MQTVAPAKINLNLRVHPRDEATGFHPIESWMVPISLADELRIERAQSSGVTLACDDPKLGGADNLARRAAELFLSETGISDGVSLDLCKIIPHGAGLGGGSSDAAAVLRVLNEQAGHPLDQPALELLGARLGSDVPFFLRGAAAMAGGRGEILELRPLPAPLDLLLLKPPFSVPTAWAYGAYDTGEFCPPNWIAPQVYREIKIFNDLERAVFRKFPMLADLKQWLLGQPLVAAAAMTGSGSCLFAILRGLRGADQLVAEAKAEFGATLWTATCRTTG